MLFVSAKVSQFALLPQGQPERYERVQAMVNTMDEMGFGNCTNTLRFAKPECPEKANFRNYRKPIGPGQWKFRRNKLEKTRKNSANSGQFPECQN